MRQHFRAILALILLSQAPLAAAFLMTGAAAWGAMALWALAQAGILVALLRPGSLLFGPVICRAPEQPRIALTFDDGPHPVDTPALLKILQRHQTRATFFFIGERARAHPDLVRRVSSEGHEVGVHSDTHRWWFSLAWRQRIRDEVERAAATVEELTDRPVRWFRSPMGHKNLFLREALERAGLDLAGWSVRPFDTIGRTPKSIAGAVLRGAAPGGIILMHEGVKRKSGAPSPTLEALGPIISGLRARGLEPVRLEDLQGIPAKAVRRAGSRGTGTDAARVSGKG